MSNNEFFKKLVNPKDIDGEEDDIMRLPILDEINLNEKWMIPITDENGSPAEISINDLIEIISRQINK